MTFSKQLKNTQGIVIFCTFCINVRVCWILVWKTISISFFKKKSCMSSIFFIKYNSKSMFLLSEYFLSISSGMCNAHAILPWFIYKRINENYIIDRHFFFKGRLNSNRNSMFFDIFLSINLIWLCQFIFLHLEN